MKYGFGKETEVARQFCQGGPNLTGEEGVFMAWETTPDAIQEALPSCLTPNAKPLIMAYIIRINETTFGPAYTEAAIGHPCSFNGIPGMYFFGMLLGGEGALMGTLMGRDGFGIPKKIAEDIQIVRTGDEVKAYVRRNGIKIIKVKLDLSEGKYNDATCFFGARKAGDSSYGGGFFFQYDIEQLENRDCQFKNIRLLHHFSTTTTQGWEPGSIDVGMKKSINDPWSAFEVVKPLGGGYVQQSLHMQHTDVYPIGDSDEVMSALITGRYDLSCFGKPLRFLK